MRGKRQGAGKMQKLKGKKPSRAPRLAPHDFLLEIGCEELPADYMPSALDWNYPPPKGLAASAARVLSEAKLVWKEIETFGLPRRLVLKVSGIDPVVREEMEGPPVSVAYAPDGKPTPAAEGFAKKMGVSLSSLKKKQTARGERLVLERSIPAEKILESAVPAIINGIFFPKTMRWDSSGVRFARPVRWLCAFYGAKPFACAYGLLKSAPETYPNRRLPQKPVKILSIHGYFLMLPKLKVQLEAGIVLSPDEQHIIRSPKKRQGLLQQLVAAAKKLGGRLPDENTEEFEWLLNTVTFLSEDPVVAVGSFQKQYLDLPTEVLATSMAKHLKLFSIREKNSEKLLPNFLAVLEGKPTIPAVVMANVDRIIEARFTDARFFYRADTKTKLESKIAQLSGVVFHEKLGTMVERIPHLERLIGLISRETNSPPAVASSAVRAVRLCKADLVTQMVREFPTLQGLIGSRYAVQDGEPAEVVTAIREHYAPRAAKDPVPSTVLGALVSLADRFDTLIGYFGVGLKPTGSADQYGLRRQATGLVRILIEPPKGVSFVGLSIDRIFDEGIQSWGARLKTDKNLLKKELHSFLIERFEWLASVRGGFTREQSEAVLSAGSDDLAGAWERLSVLAQFWNDSRRKDSLIKAAKVAERTGRIVQSVKGGNGFGSVNPDILKESSERKLWEAWNRVAPLVREQVKGRRFEEAVVTYSGLYPEVHEFFEKVFVMDEDPAVRKNRLAFMKEIHQSLAGSFADLSKLPLSGIEPSSS